MQLGSEAVRDDRRLAVRLRDAAGQLRDRWVIDASGATTVAGTVRLAGDVEVTGGVELQGSTAAPGQARPWQLYHTVAPQDGRLVDQLRVEIENPGDRADPSTYRLAIGCVDDGGTFVPCVTVTADCVVTVHGGLTVKGEVVRGPIQVDTKDPGFVSALVSAWLQGAVALGTAVDNLSSPDLDVTIDAPASVPVGTALSYKVTVKNVGTGTLDHIAAYETVALGATLVRRGYLRTGITLAPGKSVEVQAPAVTPGAVGRLQVHVVVIGVDQLNKVVAKTASRSIDVTSTGT
jgi:hypothetical protein